MAGKYGEPTLATYLRSTMKWTLILCVVGIISVGLLQSPWPAAGAVVIGATVVFYVREQLSFVRRNRDAHYHRHYARYRKPLSSADKT